MHAAIAKVLSDFADDDGDCDRGMVGDWALVLELVDRDGDLWTRTLCSDAPAWRRIGLLQYALTVQQAQVHADMRDDG